MVSYCGTLSVRRQVSNVNRASHAIGANLVLATASVSHNYDHVANTLPTEIICQLIDSTADILSTTAEAVQSTLDSFHDRDISDVLEAMQSLGTSDAATLIAYMDGESVLDMELDGWLLDEVG